MANRTGTVGGGAVSRADTRTEGTDVVSSMVTHADSMLEGTLGDGTVDLVKWEGSCPEDYGEIVRIVPRLLRMLHG
jgi:hypothetical protein